MNLPVDRELLIKRSQIPSLISQLSYEDEQQAISYLRLWGEKKKPITVMHEELTDLLSQQEVQAQ